MTLPNLPVTMPPPSASPGRPIVYHGAPGIPSLGALGDEDEDGLETTLRNDPVIAALRRYRDLAGSSFHPTSNIQEPLEPLAVSPGSPLPPVSKVLRSNVSMISGISLEGDESAVSCVCAAAPDWRNMWRSWAGPCAELPVVAEMSVAEAPEDVVYQCCGGEDPDFVTEDVGLWSPESVPATPVVRMQMTPPSAPGPLPPQEAPARPIGPLGAARQDRARPPPGMGPIKELPGLNSATYDDLDDDAKASAADAMPDPMSSPCFALGEEVVPTTTSGDGLGRVCRGRVGGLESLVTELRLQRPLDTPQKVRLHATLRSQGAVYGSVGTPLGALPTQLPDGQPGLLAIWTDAGGGGCSMSLREALRAEPPREPAWRMAVARQLCSTLAALHDGGKSHGCLGPRNIWVAPDGTLGITEVGLVDALLEAGVLREHQLLQSLGLEFARYIAPEGWEMPRRAGWEADIWALGLVLLEVLSSARPPNAECTSLQQLSAKVLPKRGRHAPHLAAGAKFTALPASIRRGLEGCLLADSAARPSARDVLFALAGPPDEDPIAARVPARQLAEMPCQVPPPPPAAHLAEDCPKPKEAHPARASPPLDIQRLPRPLVSRESRHKTPPPPPLPEPTQEPAAPPLSEPVPEPGRPLARSSGVAEVGGVEAGTGKVPSESVPHSEVGLAKPVGLRATSLFGFQPRLPSFRASGSGRRS